tara:strand:+ start:488 stop:817 length:330 start_codon:yes stop_codon:yes gene_type:complete
MKTSNITPAPAPVYTVSKIVDKYLEIQKLADIPAPKVSSILDVWGVMIELNAGKSVALTVANKDKMLDYFTNHSISIDDFNIVEASGVDNTTAGIAVISRIGGKVSCNC